MSAGSDRVGHVAGNHVHTNKGGGLEMWSCGDCVKRNDAACRVRVLVCTTERNCRTPSHRFPSHSFSQSPRSLPMVIRPPGPSLPRLRLNLINSHLSSAGSRSPIANPTRSSPLVASHSIRMASSSTGSGSGGPNSSGGAAPQATAPPKFPTTDPSKHNQPLGPGKYVEKCGMIVIGDEVLNGKVSRPKEDHEKL